MTTKLFMSPIFVINWNDYAFFSPLLWPIQWYSVYHKYILQRIWTELFLKFENVNFNPIFLILLTWKICRKACLLLEDMKKVLAFSPAFKQIKTKDFLTPFALQILLNFLFFRLKVFSQIDSGVFSGQTFDFVSPTPWAFRFHFYSPSQNYFELKKNPFTLSWIEILGRFRQLKRCRSVLPTELRQTQLVHSVGIHKSS